MRSRIYVGLGALNCAIATVYMIRREWLIAGIWFFAGVCWFINARISRSL